jgi:hypothetical protein
MGGLAGCGNSLFVAGLLPYLSEGLVRVRGLHV